MDINFHSHAWQCPNCKQYKRIKCVEGNVRIARCCGQRYTIQSAEETYTAVRTIIVDVKII